MPLGVTWGALAVLYAVGGQYSREKPAGSNCDAEEPAAVQYTHCFSRLDANFVGTEERVGGRIDACGKMTGGGAG